MVTEATTNPVPLALRIGWWTIACVLLATALVVDPFADAAFDAPKRLCLMVGAALAIVCVLRSASPICWRAWSPIARWMAVFVALGVLWLFVATIASAQPEIAWPALRRLLLIGLLLPIGASTLLDGALGRRLLVVFLIACTINAVLSLLQATGVDLPLRVSQIGGRFPTGALLGNEGYVALACSLMAAACTAIMVSDVPRKIRIAAALLTLLAIVAIAVNRQATSAIAMMIAFGVIAAVRWRARWLVALLGVAVLIGATTALVPPLRVVTWAVAPIGGVEGYQRITTYRLGAWVAALDMIAARPLTGYGPGTFAGEVQRHRLAAEIRLRERFVQPTGATFVYAHQEYLQLAADAGIPALLFFAGAAILLVVCLVRDRQLRDWPERLVLLAILITGMVAALAWFPMQIPFTAATLLLTAGRAWRLVTDIPDTPS